MLVRQCKYLQITKYFIITTENLCELPFRGILNEKKIRIILCFYVHPTTVSLVHISKTKVVTRF